MQRGQLLYDGLWRCLCPSFDKVALRTAIHRQSLPCTRSSAGWRQWAKPMHVRCYETSSGFASTNGISDNEPSQLGSETSEAQQEEEGMDGNLSGATARPWRERLLASIEPSEETLRASTTEEILAALASLRRVKRWTSEYNQEVDQHLRIIQLVQHLMKVKDQPITPFIYESLIDAMVHPRGSVEGARRILHDMADQGMKPTSEICNATLRMLMNHPDYILRLEILDVMREYWFPIDTPVKQTVVIGMLRDEQYELAYARLTEMIEQGAKVDNWVYDIFILVFGKVGFLDEMLQLLYRRKNLDSSTHPVVINLTYYALDVCSQAFHHAGTLFGWLSVVQNHLVSPPDGIVENVLGTAARNADAQLATEALDMLSRRTRTQPYHYEAVVEAFASSGDLAAAIRTLSIMQENGIRVGRGSTRTLHKALRVRQELLENAEEVVRDAARVRPVPLTAAATVIESIAEAYGSAKALYLYRDLQMLCGAKSSNARLLQNLIVYSDDEDTVKLLTKDYRDQISETDDPSQTSGRSSRLITKCAEIGEMDLAFRFVKQAMARGIAKSSSHLRWITVLVDQASSREDGRIWPVVDALLKAGDEDIVKHVLKILKQRRLSKLASEWRTKTSTTRA